MPNTSAGIIQHVMRTRRKEHQSPVKTPLAPGYKTRYVMGGKLFTTLALATEKSKNVYFVGSIADR